MTSDYCPTCRQKIPEDHEMLLVDLDCNVVIIGSKAFSLQPHEAEILHILIERTPNLVTRDTIMYKAYQLKDKEPNDKIIDVYICRIREVIKDSNYEIESLWGKGYRFVKKEVTDGD